jgi:hypothetical protein
MIRLQLRLKRLPDPIILVLVDFGEARRMYALFLLELVEPEEKLADIRPNDGCGLSMNNNVRIEEHSHGSIQTKLF